MKKYNHKRIEKKWQDIWDKSEIYRALDFSNKPKYYCLIEFPYPSGAGLHVGHLRSHIAIDIIARKKRMEGYNVLYPIGWDAFGLPTENYAIKTKTHPKIVTENNIRNYTRQVKSYGPSFDWSREINTTDPKYYKWTQWIFLKLFKSFYDDKLDEARPIEELKVPKNLREEEKKKYINSQRMAYEAEMGINWCPSCKIGLANEEVVNGNCERCGAKAEKKIMKQWMLRITKYAERLIKDLDMVDYLDKIKTQQVNWIGKSEGVIIKFSIFNFQFSNKSQIQNSKLQTNYKQITNYNKFVEVFTTRPDTIFGCTYMVLAPEHPLIKNLESRIENLEEVKKYIEQAKQKSDLDRTDLAKEKTGVELKGIKAINSANGEEIPIWIADYVLTSYGTGAIMAVPAHDQRDFEFAKKFGLPIKEVIISVFGTPHKKAEFRRTISAVVKRKSDGRFLFLKWKEFKWISPVIGGVEENESPEKAAEREALEEAGYKVRAVRKLGGMIESSFFADNKNIWRQRLDQPILLELTDDKPIKVKENEAKKHEVVWLTLEEATQKITHEYNKIGLMRYVYGETAFCEYGKLVNSGKFTGMNSENAIKEITHWLSKNNLGKKAVNYKLRDWIFSRQHYWGEPIPIIKCKKCGNAPLNEKDLPLELPDVEKYEPTNTGESPLANITDWVNVKCPKCGESAKRETDTMPNWAGSSWYFLRYLDPKNDKEFASRKKIDYWMPVDLYNGGMEHTTLHLLYSRFWHKFLYDLGYVNTAEPYKMRRSHGMILAEDGQKMSKSRGNVINPDEVIDKYGADAVRLYEMFMGPYSEAIPWNTSSLIGMSRFLERIWGLNVKVQSPNVKSISNIKYQNFELESLLHRTIKKVTEDIENLKFNTAISALMILLNEMEKEKKIFIIHYSKFLILLSPFAPHITEELWGMLGNEKSIHLQKWPAYDKELAKEKEIELVIQINGKVRDRIKAPAGISEEEAKKIAFESEKMKKWIEGKKIKKIIFVKGKLVNIVIS